MVLKWPCCEKSIIQMSPESVKRIVCVGQKKVSVWPNAKTMRSNLGLLVYYGKRNFVDAGHSIHLKYGRLFTSSLGWLLCRQIEQGSVSRRQFEAFEEGGTFWDGYIQCMCPWMVHRVGMITSHMKEMAHINFLRNSKRFILTSLANYLGSHCSLSVHTGYSYKAIFWFWMTSWTAQSPVEGNPAGTEFQR